MGRADDVVFVVVVFRDESMRELCILDGQVRAWGSHTGEVEAMGVVFAVLTLCVGVPKDMRNGEVDRFELVNG